MLLAYFFNMQVKICILGDKCISSRQCPRPPCLPCVGAQGQSLVTPPPHSQVTVLFKKFARQAAALGPGWRCVGAAEGGGLSPGHRLVKYKSELRNVTLNQPRPGLALIRLT